MPSRNVDAAIDRAVTARHRALGEELARFRADAGLSRLATARAAGVDDAFLGRIENGGERPSLETYERLAAVLGADLSIRLYPNTGPAIRNRLSAPMLEALPGSIHDRWRPFTEVAVGKPSRGWVDVVLHDAHEHNRPSHDGRAGGGSRVRAAASRRLSRASGRRPRRPDGSRPVAGCRAHLGRRDGLAGAPPPGPLTSSRAAGQGHPGPLTTHPRYPCAPAPRIHRTGP